MRKRSRPSIAILVSALVTSVIGFDPSPAAAAATNSPCLSSQPNIVLHSEQDASVYRLYCAYFLRLPDAEGFDFWRAAIASNNWTLDTASSFFAAGEESVGRYGSLTNEQFIDLVYLNVMGRVGEPGGLTFWNSRLEDGMSRGRLMLEFSDAPEFKDKVATPITALDQIAELMAQIMITPAIKASSEYDRDDYPYREAKKLAYIRDLRADNTYYSLYDGEIIPYSRRSDDLQIDHIVALNEAHQSGARTWTLDRKAAFSSDLDNLLHVSDGANQAKGGMDPRELAESEFVFQHADAECFVLVTTIVIKERWDLTMDQAEFDFIDDRTDALRCQLG